MRSPKFRFIKPELETTFDSTLLENDWKRRVRGQIRQQLLFDLIEFRDIGERVDDLIDGICSDVLGGQYRVQASKRYLIEKSKGLCRQMTLVHPRDLLVLERLSRTIYFEIVQKRPSKAAYFEPDDGNFAFAFGRLEARYGSFASWKRFQSATFGFARENEFVVVSDVANFYDFINFTHLRNVISSLVDIRESSLDLLIRLLSGLSWSPDYMPASQTGMPQIEATAPRVLANAMLYEVDMICEDLAVQNYARFMDDIDIGVESVAMAKQLVRDIDLTLQSRQLRLNSSKTRILSKKEAFKHFCISENVELARLESLLKHFGSRELFIKTISARLMSHYHKWLKKDPLGKPSPDARFFQGNGSKIHKWCLGLLYSSGNQVADDDLLWLIRNDPGMRKTAFRYLAYTKRPNTVAAKIQRILKSNTFVDDAAIVDLMIFFLNTKFRKTARLSQIVRQCIEDIKRRGDVGLYCALILSLKFCEPTEILKMIVDERTQIAQDFWLARCAAGCFPRFQADPKLRSEFVEAIRSFGNDDAESVLSYHLNISQNKITSQSMKSYLEVVNPSLPQRIYFPKVLAILSVSNNPHESTRYARLLKEHKALTSDPYLKQMGF